MSKDDPDHYRKQAEECRRLAAQAVNPIDKDAWHRMADDWLKLAQEAELRR